MASKDNVRRAGVRATICDGFWHAYQKLVRERVIPYQWRAMNDLIPGAPPSHSVSNFRVAAGKSDQKYDGPVFQDSDLYKWLEAVGNTMGDGTADLEEVVRQTEEVCGLIADAQLPDGYLNTYFILNRNETRWTNLRDAHELYCAGHLIEAAVALARGGRSDLLIGVARKLADHIDATFGPAAGKMRGIPGHEEIELALIKLYRLTEEPRYLDLARYFVDERGRRPSRFETEIGSRGYRSIFGARQLEYFQAHAPLQEQTEIVGHAVRAMYFCCAIADLALETGESIYVSAADRLWKDTTGRKMYVTGSIGSSAENEAFGPAFDLPGDSAYAETCAAIGLFLFSSRMLRLHDDGRYADVMERCLYNGILSGLALDGESYFYVNPLEVYPEVSDHNPSFRFVKYRRQPWYGCACCPPNIARTIAGLGDHLYHLTEDTLYVDLYHDGTASFEVDGTPVSVRQLTRYPWDGEVQIVVSPETPRTFDVAVRIPDWCRAAELEINGTRRPAGRSPDGYERLQREWKSGDRIKLRLPMPAERVYADSRVRSAFGKVAVQRGPLIYCLEEADNSHELYALRLPIDADISVTERPDLLGGIVVLRATGEKSSPADNGLPALYHMETQKLVRSQQPLIFVPYFAWANRTVGSMAVWLQE